MKKGFSYIELIFVIIIIGVLSAVALPKLFNTRESSLKMKANTELVAIKAGLKRFEQDSLYETGRAKYPASFCDTKNLCKAGDGFYAVSEINNKIVKNYWTFAGSRENQTYTYYPQGVGSKHSITLRYSPSAKQLVCQSATGALNCKDIDL